MPARRAYAITGIATLLFTSQPSTPASAQSPWWLDSLGYTPSQAFAIQVGPDRYPYIPVRINGTELQLLFDTGNMVGLTVATAEFDRLRLPVTGTVRRRSSSGDVVGQFRIGRAERVEALSHVVTGVAIHEFQHPRFAGLYGPTHVPGDRFTLDYQRQVIAVGESVPGLPLEQGALPLVRSSHHPRLILVEGAVQGKAVLIELDTGKSRTVVDPAWAKSIGLVVGSADTVRVGEVSVGDFVFDVRDAKPVSLGAIDPTLPSPLALSLGSDMLSRVVLTVDYARGRALLLKPR